MENLILLGGIKVNKPKSLRDSVSNTDIRMDKRLKSQARAYKIRHAWQSLPFDLFVKIWILILIGIIVGLTFAVLDYQDQVRNLQDQIVSEKYYYNECTEMLFKINNKGE